MFAAYTFRLSAAVAAIFLILPFPASSAIAAVGTVLEPSPRVYNEMPGESERAVYIVQLTDPPLAIYDGRIPGLAATAPGVLGSRKLDVDSPASHAYEAFLAERQSSLIAAMGGLLGRSLDIRFIYRHAYNGVAVVLSPVEAAQVLELDGVRLIYRESEDELLTDAGPAFVGAIQNWGGDDNERYFSSELDGSQEVPPTPSSATGEASISFDVTTSELSWFISHDVASPTAAHIHSGAAGINGPVEVPLDHTVNPMVGSTVLMSDQRGMLMNGNLYINIHTSTFPGGEIRGQILAEGSRGEGIIVGIIDTGINSGHPAFAEVAGDGYAHVNPYGSGNYVGYCVANPSFCNDKLIGAWALHTSSTDPEDANGHGSHVAGTTAGNWLPNPTLIAPTTSYPFAAASGVAPRANIIAYQVCVPSCPTASTTAAVNQAVIDGVDVLNYSISGGTNPYVDTTAEAFRNAAAAGVTSAASAGNAGPGAGTVTHQAPWLMTVAASTHDRAILNRVTELNSTGDSLPDLLGQSPTVGYGPAPLVYAGDLGNPLCDPFVGTPFSGEIVVCDRGVIGRVQKGANVLAAGAGGMILVNDEPNAASLNDDAHVLPATHVSYADGLLLKAWMAANANPIGRIEGGVIDYDPLYGDYMASFSARGPAGSAVPGLANLLKPDVSAPGLNILAPYFAGFSAPPAYNIISGTSMSSPHAAGASALLKSVHPGWSPAEIKSAFMLTGNGDLTREDAMTPAGPFDFGAGRIEVNRAAGVGFVLEVTNADYIAANPAIGGDPRLLNLASMADTDCVGACSWTRTIRSVLDEPQDYVAWIEAPAGISGSVSPASFSLAPGGEQALTIELDVFGATADVWAFARVRIEPAGLLQRGESAPAVGMPIAVIPRLVPPGIDVAPTSLTASVLPDGSANRALTLHNSGGEDLVWSISAAEPATANGRGGFWSEDFDSYSAGQDIHGVGGWKGWDNNPSLSALVSDAQSRSLPNSLAIGGSNDPVREFSGVTSGVWTLRAWQYFPAAASGTQYFIVLNTYNDGGAKNWSVQVRFDAANNQVVNDGVSGGTLALVRDSWVEIRLEIDLDGDSQTFYYNDQQLYTGSWTGQVSGGGQSAIGAVNLFANSAGTIFYDDLSLVAGIGPCADPVDIAWLSATPDSGALSSLEEEIVDVAFDATGLGLGDYNAILCVTSNALNNSLIEVPVLLRVVDDEMFADRFEE
jgi:subtilisin family serine protease